MRDESPVTGVPRPLPKLECDEFVAEMLDDRSLTLTVWDADGVAQLGLGDVQVLRDWLDEAILLLGSAS